MKKFSIAAALIVLALVVSACGAKSGGGDGSSAASGSGNNGGTKAVKKIIVGTGTQFPNVCFIDDSGKLTGFDVELVRELDKRLPEYEFEFKTMDFSNLLLSLETNKIDFIAHQMEKNPERIEKFLFNKEPYSIFLTKVAVDKNNTTIHSIEDLKGKKVYTTPTSNAAYFLEQYNKDHDNALNIVYSSGAANDLVNIIQSKRVDATMSTDFALAFYPGADGQPALKTVGEPLIQSDVLFVLRKDGQELSDKLDEAIKSVKEDGTLSKLSIQWLGQDFTKSLDEATTK
ncbi:transporter substrate-binding domain-containing protein [Paenibacillus radicis (ex Gao et al. 2016)]|uniref:L-cystine-binding protein TcyK n=1 Tax=Paenibacillus radicis (ex Gao et al. 2016) TaxID=1737354 RepID=A0A917HFW4_9BACL|nr:transporter substrate-binding domain-containing protein [Paenibacillus radicis (ex Gao et al. 2016)]GGG77272.1 L-cystine-binding protein TcyK [Paenibacillus radicis (ex Gao et al. 2016)]